MCRREATAIVKIMTMSNLVYRARATTYESESEIKSRESAKERVPFNLEGDRLLVNRSQRF